MRTGSGIPIFGVCLMVLATLLAATEVLCGGTWQETAGDREQSLPVSGDAVEGMADVEAAMIRFMSARSIKAGTLAIGRNGEVVLSRGFGWSDESRTFPLAHDASLRIASLAKPLTAAAVHKLVRDGKLALDDKAIDYLKDLTPPGAATPDDRLGSITVRHLLEHKGGWDRDGTRFDPMFASKKICRDLGLKGPATAHDTIRWMFGRPLDFAPGEKSAYSNFGYCVLGRVIEGASGQPYIDYLRDEIMLPVNATTCRLARTRIEDREPDEPVYIHARRLPSVFTATGWEMVAAPYGGFYIEAMDAHGGLICSAEDLCKFMNVYWLTGKPRRESESQRWIFFGSLPGTFTCMTQRADGVVWAALFNQREDASGLKYELIQQELDAALDNVSW